METMFIKYFVSLILVKIFFMKNKKRDLDVYLFNILDWFEKTSFDIKKSKLMHKLWHDLINIKLPSNVANQLNRF